jgi:hypothetical protein
MSGNKDRFPANTTREVIDMPKDSQLDPKDVRREKARGGPTLAQSNLDGESNNNKKQSGSRVKSGDDKAQS